MRSAVATSLGGVDEARRECRGVRGHTAHSVRFRPGSRRRRSSPAQGSEPRTLSSRSIRSPDAPILFRDAPLRAAPPAPAAVLRAAALLVPVLLIALAAAPVAPRRPLPPPPPPSDGSPGSAGVPVMGQSRLTADQLVAYYQKRSGLAVPRHRRHPRSSSRDMFVTEGNRYNVRGDIAFAQSIVETAWFNYPDYGMVRPYNNNFSGIGACDTCGNGFQFSTALAGVRAQLQLLRNYADSSVEHLEHPRPAGARAVGQHPVDRGVQLRPLLRQGPRAALEQHGQRQLGDGAELRDRRAQRLQPDAHRQRRTRAVPGRRAPLRSAHRGRPVPGQPPPARPCDRHHRVRWYVRAERQRRGHRVQRCDQTSGHRRCPTPTRSATST